MIVQGKTGRTSDGLRAKYGKVENRGLMTVLYQVEAIKEEL